MSRSTWKSPYHLFMPMISTASSFELTRVSAWRVCDGSVLAIGDLR